MIRIEDIRSEPTPVREWVLNVDNEVDIVRESLSNCFDINCFNDSVDKLLPTNFSQYWGLIIFKPIDIPQELEPV